MVRSPSPVALGMGFFAAVLLSCFYVKPHAAVQLQTSQFDGDPPKSNGKANVVDGYLKWRRVNAATMVMQPATSAQCAEPRPNQLQSPHLLKYINVYVNSIGSETMNSVGAPHFPVGTVIVKEKMTKVDDKSPELLTVMVKHEKGFNKACFDWEFLVFKGAGAKVTASGKLTKCQSCHLQPPAKESDGVFREYYLKQTSL